MHAAMIKGPRCSPDVEITDGRPECGHGLEVVITRMCLNDLMSKDEICRSWASLSFLDANSVERIAIDICTSQSEERHRKNRFALCVTKKAATTIP